MLELRAIQKTYEGQLLLRDISFSLNDGETICLLGASGSGKSTLLRMIAGLEPPDSGQILWDGIDLSFTPPHLRDFGLVFQDYALFPHLTVFDNAAFGLKMKNWPKNKIQARAAEVLDIVNLNEFGNRKVTDLSGGEQQRVALARALAPHPKLLMFDEPLGALDRTLREGLLNQLRGILHRTKIPAIYVTHDQEEAFTIADRVLLLHEGLIVRAGNPKDVWENPDSVWAAKFLGLGNVFDGKIISRNKVETLHGTFSVKCGHKHRDGGKVHLLARPLEAREEANVIRGRVADVIFQSDRFKVTLDNSLYFYLKDEPKIGKRIQVKIKLECLG